jgi:cold shock CspA family protein
MAVRISGKVKWWNSTKGYGFLEQPNGPDVFVHFSALNMEGFRDLTDGQDVEFSIEKGPKGDMASNVVPIDKGLILEEKPPVPVLTQKSSSISDKSENKVHQDSQSLRVFLCHSSNDKPLVRKLYQRLKSDNFDPWLDEEKLLPGQDWKQEIPKAVHKADVVIVCLSRGSITKTGYVQKEITYALDVAEEQPEGTIFLIPLKLEECEVPERLSRWHWVNYYERNGYKRLLEALNVRAAAK